MSSYVGSLLPGGSSTPLSRRNIPTSYDVWYDGALYHADSMLGTADITPNSDASTLINSVFSTMVAANRMGEVRLSAQDFVINSQINIPAGGFVLRGMGSGTKSPPYRQEATILRAGANSITMLKYTGGGVAPPQQYRFSDFALATNGKTGVIGIDMSGSDTSGVGGLLDHLWWDTTDANGTPVGDGTQKWDTCAKLNGCEDTVMAYCGVDGNGTMVHSTNATVEWKVPGGNANIQNCIFLGGLVAVNAQTIGITGGTYGSFKLLGSGSSSLRNIFSITNAYLANPSFAGALLNLNGFVCDSFTLKGCPILLSATNAQSMFAGPGTCVNFGIDGCGIITVGAPAWSTGAPTLTKSNTAGTNHFVGTTPTGFPFTVDGNGNF